MYIHRQFVWTARSLSMSNLHKKGFFSIDEADGESHFFALLELMLLHILKLNFCCLDSDWLSRLHTIQKDTTNFVRLRLVARMHQFMTTPTICPPMQIYIDGLFLQNLAYKIFINVYIFNIGIVSCSWFDVCSLS